MSKLVKGVKKVFKKVIKVVKKIAVPVLAAAAIFFTAGAALGITAAAGGWSAAAATITSSLGTGALGATVTGALTQAGMGAAIGGIASKAMGGSFTEGAKAGAIGGAITGGVGGYLGHAKNAAMVSENAVGGLGGPNAGALPPPAGVGPGGEMLGDMPASGPLLDSMGTPIIPGNPQQSMAPQGSPNAVYGGSSGGPPGAPAPPGPFNGPYAPGFDPAAGGTAPPGGLNQSPPLNEVALSARPMSDLSGVKGASSSPGFFAEGGWMDRNQTVVGGAIKGIGMGLSADAAADGDLEFLNERQRLISQNYDGTDPGAQYRSVAGSNSRTDRYDPKTYGSFTWEYDPAQGRVIKVPAGGG